MALATVLRAMFGYLFLIFMTRIVGRRPGKQLTPFEFVLIFFLGGLTLTGMVGDEVSLSSAVCQIITLALTHYLLAFARSRYPRLARILDGTPLTLMELGQQRSDTMKRMGIQEEDLMAMARDQGMKSLHEVGIATLERNGEITIIESNSKKD